MRLAVAIPLLLLFLWAQRYWFLRFWHVANRASSPLFRRLLRSTTICTFGFITAVLTLTFFIGRRDLIWRFATLVGVIGLWITTAFFSWASIRLIAGIGWIFASKQRRRATPGGAATPAPTSVGRRQFVEAATLLAGTAPFGLGAYGFLVGRHEFRVNEVDVPISGLPQALEGLRITQLSDIHIGSYISTADVRRVVGMANELKPDLAVITGDFITGPNDPLESCIAELAALRAPLGIWGCNGNHEIYADAEVKAAELFAQRRMKLLRQENAEISYHGAKFNLIGVDYQLTRTPGGRSLTMLSNTGTLVRQGMPNILLSHNPNSFPRAAELGIDLMLTGHTHGGQVRVEILDHRFSPAQFLTPYVAGLYKRPLGSPATLDDDDAWSIAAAGASFVYVNRGLGTIGAPVRLGVPPEISLLTMRCA